MAADDEIDLLTIERGAITAPAGCGKTHLIADALTRHNGAKPVMILTHTNAAWSRCAKSSTVSALRPSHTA
jgi:superfamily II DNA or RNA helicase